METASRREMQEVRLRADTTSFSSGWSRNYPRVVSDREASRPDGNGVASLRVTRRTHTFNL